MSGYILITGDTNGEQGKTRFLLSWSLHSIGGGEEEYIDNQHRKKIPESGEC